MRAPGLLAVAASLVACPALADVEDWEGDYVPEKASRRSDLAMGIGLGGAVGRISGYPNELKKIDVSGYEADTGLAAGGSGTVWLGVALRDWLTFGFGFSSITMGGGGLGSSGGAIHLHAEAFPLFYEGGAFEDLGLVAEVGGGWRSLERGKDFVADGGSMAVVGLGAVYEPIRFGSFSAGPLLEGLYQFSPSMTSVVGILSFRVAFYGGPG